MPLQQGKDQPPSTRKDKGLKRLTNGQVIEFLRTLPENHPFAVPENDEKRKFLRQLYVPLRDLFSTTTTSSRANRTRVLAISHLEVLKSLHARFLDFEADPLEFWERLTEVLPQYSENGADNRAKIFLESAVQLDTNIQEQLILQRFVSLAAYKLFQRAIPTSGTRIMPETLKRFLIHVGIWSSDCDDQDLCKYGEIIKRGQRHERFCQVLMASQSTDEDTPDNNARRETGVNWEYDNETYGPLFFSSIPDTIWDEKGLLGEDYEISIKHLRQIKVQEKSREANASHMAKVLLDFHTEFVWVKEVSPSSPRKRKEGEPRNAATRGKRRRAEFLEPSFTAATTHQQDVRPPGEPIIQPRLSAEQIREGCCQTNVGLYSTSTWRASEIRHPDTGPSRLPGITQHERGPTGIAPGRARLEDEQSRFDTLVSAACSTDPAEQLQEGAGRVTTADFIPPLAQTQETLLDITALDFVVPLLDVADLEFVDPQSSMFAQLHSFEQDISLVPN